MKTYQGGCHCGQVTFEIDTTDKITVLECNCSICSMSGFLHLIVRKEDFRLTTDIEGLTTYRFNTGTARHIFCPRCGVKSFYIPRSHPSGFSVNLRCLANVDYANVKFHSFDGKNWEAAIHVLRTEN